MRAVLGGLIWCLSAAASVAAPRDAVFANIDGGTLQFDDWAGKPVLVVNTASECGFTYQYEGLQKLSDQYASEGLIVLTVPSDDFRQELVDGAAVKEFCEINYGLDLPMADITHVKGDQAHPFYKSVKKETGFVPSWNFNKVLIGADGKILGTWRASTRPQSKKITRAVEHALR